MIEWKPSRYGNSYTAKLAPTLTIDVTQGIGERYGPEPPWLVRVFERKLDARFSNADDAKAYAIDVARRQVAIAAERLSPLDSLPTGRLQT